MKHPQLYKYETYGFTGGHVHRKTDPYTYAHWQVRTYVLRARKYDYIVKPCVITERGTSSLGENVFRVPAGAVDHLSLDDLRRLDTLEMHVARPFVDGKTDVRLGHYTMPNGEFVELTLSNHSHPLKRHAMTKQEFSKLLTTNDPFVIEVRYRLWSMNNQPGTGWADRNSLSNVLQSFRIAGSSFFSYNRRNDEFTVDARVIDALCNTDDQTCIDVARDLVKQFEAYRDAATFLGEHIPRGYTMMYDKINGSLLIQRP